MSRLSFLGRLLEKQMQNETKFHRQSIPSLIFILEVSVLDSTRPLWRFSERQMYGAVWIRWEPWSPVGLGDRFSPQVCFDFTPSWSSCSVHQIWCAFVQPQSDQYGWYCPSETVHKQNKLNITCKQFFLHFYVTSGWPLGLEMMSHSQLNVENANEASISVVR